MAQLAITAGLAFAYIALFDITNLICDMQGVSGVATLFFPPAFVRLVGFLLVGYRVVPALFLAALCCVDLGLGACAQVTVAGALAVGSPLAMGLAARGLGLARSLVNLTGGKLIILVLASASGSAICYYAALNFVGVATESPRTVLAVVLGDATGSLCMVYLTKAILHALKRDASVS